MARRINHTLMRDWMRAVCKVKKLDPRNETIKSLQDIASIDRSILTFEKFLETF